MSDRTPLTDKQRQKLCDILVDVLCEIRQVGFKGNAREAGEIAEAFHNLPGVMWHDDFSFDELREDLESLFKKGLAPKHWLVLLEKIKEMK